MGCRNRTAGLETYPTKSQSPTAVRYIRQSRAAKGGTRSAGDAPGDDGRQRPWLALLRLCREHRLPFRLGDPHVIVSDEDRDRDLVVEDDALVAGAQHVALAVERARIDVQDQRSRGRRAVVL